MSFFNMQLYIQLGWNILLLFPYWHTYVQPLSDQLYPLLAFCQEFQREPETATCSRALIAGQVKRVLSALSHPSMVTGISTMSEQLPLNGMDNERNSVFRIFSFGSSIGDFAAGSACLHSSSLCRVHWTIPCILMETPLDCQINIHEVSSASKLKCSSMLGNWSCATTNVLLAIGFNLLSTLKS